MKKLFILLSFILISLFSFSVENQNVKIEKLAKQIKELKEENLNLKSYKTLYEDQFKILEKQQQNNLETLNLKYMKLLYSGGVGFVVFLITAGFTYFRQNKLKEKIPELVENDVNAKVKSEVDKEVSKKIEEESRELSNRIYNEYRDRVLSELLLKYSKKILVLYETEIDLIDKMGKISLKDYLKHLEFQNVKFENITNIEKEKTANYDLIVFLHSKPYTDEIKVYEGGKAQEIIDFNSEGKTVFFYLNEFYKQHRLKNAYINNATSYTSLYRNIMDTLEFQNYLNKLN